MSPTDEQKTWNRSFRIRGVKDASTPHAACPDCYADCTSNDSGQLLQYRCARGHEFTGYRSDGLNHAQFLARYVTSTEANR